MNSEAQSNAEKRAAIAAQTQLPANVKLPSEQHEAITVPAAVEHYTQELVYIPPKAKELICANIDARLKQRLEDAVLAHRRARSGHGTQRKVLESALTLWLDKFEKPKIKVA